MSAIATATKPRRLSAILEHENRFDLCVVLTLLLLLLYADSYWYIKIPLSVIAIVGFIYPGVRTSRALWAAATVIVAVGLVSNWYAVDNHKYLLGYWCLAVCLALLARSPDRTLAISARWLIVPVFLLAVVQKTLSPDYLSGAFFYYELLLDDRFAGLAKYIGGVPDHLRQLNEAARRALVNFDSSLTAVRLQGTPPLAVLGGFVTWWNYLIQAVIALAFALPRSNRFARTRDAWLLLFLFTTYLFAPVIGFGWVLAIMGIAQTDRDQVRVRGLYVAAFLFLQVYRIPWSEMFSSLAGAG